MKPLFFSAAIVVSALAGGLAFAANVPGDAPMAAAPAKPAPAAATNHRYHRRHVTHAAPDKAPKLIPLSHGPIVTKPTAPPQ